MSDTTKNTNAYSSRGTILDSVDMVSHLERASSHLMEYMQSLRDKFALTGDPTSKKQLELLTKLLTGIVNLRRNLMKQTEEEIGGVPEMWCPVKHLITQYGLAQELLQANLGSENQAVYEDLYDESWQLLIATVSIWAGIDEWVTCARCSQDKIQQKKIQL